MGPVTGCSGIVPEESTNCTKIFSNTRNLSAMINVPSTLLSDLKPSKKKKEWGLDLCSIDQKFHKVFENT